MAQQTVLVTGASSGIGWELAKQFAKQGDSLVLLARGRDTLESLAQALRNDFKVNAEVLEADLSAPNAAQRIADELAQRQITVDVLVNNAGFGLMGPHAVLDLQRQLDMIQVNVTAVVHLTRLLLPGMIERKCGGVLNVASTAAFQAGPLMAIYYATKAFVLSYSEALHEELAGSGVQVSCLCPGATSTGFAAAASMEGSRLFGFGTQTAEAVAQVGHAGLQHNRAIVVSGLKNKLLAWSGKFSPRAITRKIAMSLNQ